VLFEKLIEQHRIHRFIAHCLGLAVGIVDHKVRIYFGNFFRDQAILRCASLIALVVEGYRLKRQDGFPPASWYFPNTADTFSARSRLLSAS
jgi:hypothetical protein